LPELYIFDLESRLDPPDVLKATAGRCLLFMSELNPFIEERCTISQQE
jgi:hypothetical protein